VFGAIKSDKTFATFPKTCKIDYNPLPWPPNYEQMNGFMMKQIVCPHQQNVSIGKKIEVSLNFDSGSKLGYC
jgi:hypothetical protein